MPAPSPRSRVWRTRREVVCAKSTAAGETGTSVVQGGAVVIEIRLGGGEIQPQPPRIPAPPAVVDLAVLSPSRREPQAGCSAPAVCSGPSSAWARHAHDTYPPTTTGLKNVESGARAPLGKEEPAGKEGRVVGWPAMLMRPPAGRLDGEPRRGVGKEAERKRERWHGTQREEAAGLMPCSTGKKERGEVFL
jgi:hypothetical protein